MLDILKNEEYEVIMRLLFVYVMTIEEGNNQEVAIDIAAQGGNNPPDVLGDNVPNVVDANEISVVRVENPAVDTTNLWKFLVPCIAVLLMAGYCSLVLGGTALFFARMTPQLRDSPDIFVGPNIVSKWENTTERDMIYSRFASNISQHRDKMATERPYILSEPCIVKAHIGVNASLDDMDNLVCPPGYELRDPTHECHGYNECSALKNMHYPYMLCAYTHPVCDYNVQCINRDITIMGDEWYTLYPATDYAWNITYTSVILWYILCGTVCIMLILMAVAWSVPAPDADALQKKVDFLQCLAMWFITGLIIGISIISFLGMIAWPILYNYYDDLPLYTSDDTCFISNYELFQNIYKLEGLAIASAILANALVIAINITVGAIICCFMCAIPV